MADKEKYKAHLKKMYGDTEGGIIFQNIENIKYKREKQQEYMRNKEKVKK